jgi:hypothetical protein
MWSGGSWSACVLKLETVMALVKADTLRAARTLQPLRSPGS